MDIRIAEESDIDRMLEVYADGRASLGALGIDQWQDGYPQRWRVEADVARREARVACDDDGRIVGCIVAIFTGEPDYDAIDGAWLTKGTSADPGYVVIHRVATAADALGRGVATALFDEVEREAREAGCESVRIDTHYGNSPMRSLVAKRGYAACGEVVMSCVGTMTPERIAYEKLL